MPEWVQDLTFSDYLVLIAAGALLWFLVDYGVFTPWWRYKEHGFIGYAVMLFTGSVAVLLGMIIWAAIMGQRISEPARIVAGILLVVGMIAKIIILHHERKAGRIDRQRAQGGGLMTEVKPGALSVPDIWYKAQRVLRTVFAVLVGFLTFWAGFQLIAPQILAELANVLPGSWVAWLTGTIAAITTIAGVITRILAIPAVNAAFTKIGLGSVPKAALVPAQVIDNGNVQVITTVQPDPKADPAPTPLPPGGAVG